MSLSSCESWEQPGGKCLAARRFLIRSTVLSTVLSIPFATFNLVYISSAFAEDASFHNSFSGASEARSLTSNSQFMIAQVQSTAPELADQISLSQQIAEQAGNASAGEKVSHPSLSQQTQRRVSADPARLQSFPQQLSEAQYLNAIPSQTSEQLAQRVVLRDIRGHWAQSFIEPLVQQGVIRGFPDGSFRPDQPVTRVQFAAMIRQAFAGAPVRSPINFTDVPSSYWGYAAVREAYSLGFLQGFPDNSFQPDKDISRVQALVALSTGLRLDPAGDPSSLLSATFADARQVPNWAGRQVAAATEKAIVVSYPDVGLLRPNQTATRADVAAFIHQSLVSAGSLPALSASNRATPYIVGYQSPGPSAAEIQAQRRQLLLPTPPVEERTAVRAPRNRGIPGSSIGIPTAFGADWGDVFVGGSFQERTRFTQTADGAVGLGFGLGDAQKLVGLELSVAFVDLEGDTFQDGGFSFKVHRQLPWGVAIAGGVENVATFGDPDGDQSGYGVVSKVWQFDQPSQPFSTLTTSVGLGGGRFRQEVDLDEDIVNVFGSVGLRVVEPVSAIVEWSGQDLNAGLSIAPFRNIPLVITPAAADITGNAGDGVRFILGVGFGANFRGF
ncbi:MAG: S-layer homology domain-containing protein [Leptolyngbyaceae cyanobacterium MO_188.B28]|nr:S-layer homology domain-containing protein [Leptolyngbyaceae cyanobacterium MO_188.B28]